jgi:hypothetical protein
VTALRGVPETDRFFLHSKRFRSQWILDCLRQSFQRMLPEKPMLVRTRKLKPEVVAMKPAQQSRAG